MVFRLTVVRGVSFLSLLLFSTEIRKYCGTLAMVYSIVKQRVCGCNNMMLGIISKRAKEA